jgi:hypothetical protein
VNIENKEQLRPKKFKQMLSARKLMAIVFQGRKGVLMVEIMQQGTITSEAYCKTRKPPKKVASFRTKGVEC